MHEDNPTDDPNEALWLMQLTCGMGGDFDAQAAQQLLERKAEPNHRRRPDLQPILSSVISPPDKTGATAFAKFLVEAKADFHARSYGMTAIHDASAVGNAELLEFLVEKKADPHATNDAPTANLFGGNALHCAIYYIGWAGRERDCTDVVRVLLANKVDLNCQAAKDEIGTPLQLATRNARHEIANLLKQAKTVKPAPPAPPAPMVQASHFAVKTDPQDATEISTQPAKQ